MYIDPVYFCFCSNIICGVFFLFFFYYFFIFFLIKNRKRKHYFFFLCTIIIYVWDSYIYDRIYIYIFFLFYDRCISFSYTSVICFFISFVHSRIYSSTLSTDCCCCCCCIFAIIPITLLLLLLPGCAIICCAV